MTKSEFLAKLESALAQLTDNERQQRLEYYAEILDDMTEDGMEEAEAVKRLEPVGVIAERILQEMPLSKLVGSRVRPKSGWGPMSITLAIVGSPVWLPLLLVFVAVLFVLFLVIWLLIIVAFLLVACLGAAGILLAVGGVIRFGGQLLTSLFFVGAGITVCGLCVLAFFGARAMGHGLVELTVWLFHKVKSMFIRKGANT